jgi:hypothetical protein
MAKGRSESPIPFRDGAGHWVVGDKWFHTNAEAWRYIDKMENSPLSRAEDVNAWINKKMLDE